MYKNKKFGSLSLVVVFTVLSLFLIFNKNSMKPNSFSAEAINEIESHQTSSGRNAKLLEMRSNTASMMLGVAEIPEPKAAFEAYLLSYKQLKKKTLKTAQEKLEFSKFTNDLKMIRHFGSVLMEVPVQFKSSDQMDLRLDAVDFFLAAIEVNNITEIKNGYIKSVLLEFLKKEFDDRFDLKVKQFIAGDRIELLTGIKRYSPDLYQELLEKSEGNSELKRLIKFSESKA